MAGPHSDLPGGWGRNPIFGILECYGYKGPLSESSVQGCKVVSCPVHSNESLFQVDVLRRILRFSCLSETKCLNLVMMPVEGGEVGMVGYMPDITTSDLTQPPNFRQRETEA